ncbi:MAG TPA: ABC transporter permease [Vicinamibacterales bacterium]|nr:ABC transporter permease [Vicinamibacterales bacterium]
MFDVWQDLRYSTRRLAAQPGYTILMIATLALAIGATTAVFTVVDETLLRPVPFAFPERLVDVFDTNRATRGGGSSLTPEKIAGWQTSPLFERFEGYSPRQFDIAGDGEPERVMGLLVSTGLFPMLGAQPRLGRAFAADEGRAGSPRVVIISEGLWRRRFGGSIDAIGRTLVLNDEPFTIVGVMPRRFHLSRSDFFWLPLDILHPRPEDALPQFYGVARLASGVALPSVQDRANALADEYQKARPLARTWDLMIRPKTVASVDASARTLMFVLLGAVGFVLLIACANVANLFLSRAAAREREVAVRSALGASRARLIRETLAESLLLGALGGCAGVLLAVWGVQAAVAAAPASLAFMTTNTIEIDGRILFVAAMLTIASGVLVGLAPAVRGSRPGVEQRLRASGHTSTRHAAGAPSVLVVTEVALALVLLVATALMTRTFIKLHAIDPGFDLRDVAALHVGLPSDRYPTPAARFAFTQDLSQRLRALPGTSSVSISTTAAPPAVGSFSWGLESEAGPASANDQIMFVQNTVTPDYFQTLRIPLLAGRTFSADDGDDVAIVSRAAADYFWVGREAIGRRLRFSAKQPWLTVVGIVGNVETRLGDNRLPRQVYLPLAAPRTTASTAAPRRRVYYGFWLMMRTADARSKLVAMKSQVSAIDKRQPVDQLILIEDTWADAFGRQRFALLLMSVFAAIAVVLASAGVLAVLSQIVRQRTREIAIRVALGATPANVFGMIVGRGMILTLIGVGVGLSGAAALSRVLTSLLFEVSPYDPVSFVVVAAVLTAVAFGACWLPARRAMKIEPSVALRIE